MKKNMMLDVYMLIVLALVLFVIVFARNKFYHSAINSEEAANKVVNIVNKYFVPDKNAKISGKAIQEKEFYKVGVDVGNNTQYFYLTKDGATLIFPNGMIDIAKFEESNKAQEKSAIIPKSAKPSVELFVMSLCPYGLKAEKEAWAVAKLFGEKIDFKIKFIVTVKGDTINEVVSSHGIDEAKEDARAAAIMQYYPDKFADYLNRIDENSCVISCGAIKLEDYWKKTAKNLGIDTAKIERFAYGQEGVKLLKQNGADVVKYNVNSSPTLFINGVMSKSIYQGPEALKRAICFAFTNQPAECQAAADK